ncbi:acyltransferase [Hydrogenimonas sp. SS33]|uniref:acyltransferase family protein n=1 Tax=Hydrogenimonas leucolamina TaxID=2954236 RepID=UPI00336C0F60
MRIFQKERKFHIDPVLSSFLHLSRWIAALMVVLSHVRAVTFPPYSQLGENGWQWKIFYYMTSLGHEAVMIFFILSGFLIGGEVLRGMLNEDFNWKKYFTKRVIRLYIVLIPALFLTFVWDHVGYRFFNDFNAYDRFFEKGKETIETFLLNFSMLQHSYGPLFGSNDPLWSLAYEFWYYLFFPIGMIIILSNSWKNRFLALSAFLFLAAVLNKMILLYFFVWLTGVGIWFVRENLVTKIKYSPLLLWISFLGVLTFSRFKEGFWGDFLLGLVFALTILYIKSGPKISKASESFITAKFHPFMADFSYSLYLLHFPFMLLIAQISYRYFRDFREHTDLSNGLAMGVMILLIYLYSYSIYYFTERYYRPAANFILDHIDHQGKNRDG